MKKKLLRLFLIGVMSIFTLGMPAQTPDYLCFTANTPSSTVELKKYSTPTAVTIEYSTDGMSWTSVNFSSEITTGAITLTNKGDKVYFRNAADEVTKFTTATNKYYYFEMTGSIAASGNVMSLIDKGCTSTTIPNTFCFCNLFENCESLTSAPELPATTLKMNCYTGMFEYCTNLTSAPELPATTLIRNCYSYMFNGCTKLNQVKVAFTEWTSNAINDWLSDVAETGTFVCSDALDKTNNIPEGWTPVFEVKANNKPSTNEYYATFYSDKNVYKVPKGVVAYTGVVDGKVLRLTAVANSIIPADEAVILKATQSQVYLPYTTESATKSMDNKLLGTEEAMTLGVNDYALSLGQNGMGFYLWNGNTIGANKAYLTLPAATAKAFTFQFDDETDAIHSCQLSTVNSQLYNLNGMRVKDGYKGIVIKNGKKIYQK